MTEKEFQKLSRRQLLELLLLQTERADSLAAELELTKDKLQSKILAEKEAGSIAEAALRLNGIFEAADAAAAQYLENISMTKELQKKLLADAEKEVKQIIADAEAEAARIRLEAEALLKEARDSARK